MRAVLTFHSVDPSGSVLSITPEQLRSLVVAIRRSGHRIVPLRDLLEAQTATPQVALTFDDGLRSVHECALPVLREEAATATVFLTTGHVGRDNRWSSLAVEAPTMEMLSWSEVEALHAAGWAVEAHTATHPDLRKLNDDRIRAECEDANQAIVQRLGCCPTVFAYPYGYLDDRVRRLVAGYYRYAVTARMGVLPTLTVDAHQIPRLESFYFRASRVHARFGTRTFDAYLAARTLLRAVRPG
jgi:peptidoglycan/xylan/chitin deacetylase (PgdA/CDA1 family)